MLLDIEFDTKNPESRSQVAPVFDWVRDSEIFFGSYSGATRELSIIGDRTIHLEVDSNDYETTPFDLSFRVSGDVENVLKVIIDGTVYTMGTEPLSAGEYLFDSFSKLVQLSFAKYSGHLSSVSYVGQIKSLNYYSLPCTSRCDYDVPQFFEAWNISDSITISKTFQGHSELKFGFTALRTQISQVKEYFVNGKTFIGFRHKWRIISHAITFLAKTDSIVVAIACQDWLAPYGIPSRSKLDKLLPLAIAGDQFTGTRYLSEYANESGVSVDGADIKVVVPKGTIESETTTLRELLDSRAVTVKSFVHYAKSGVELRKWGFTKSHVISENDLRSDFNEDYSGNGNLLFGTKLSTEYRNLKIDLQVEESEQQEQSQGITTRWTFENCTSLEDLYSPREFHGFYYTQPSPQVLRSPGACFDAGGRTKKATKVTELNGTVVFEESYEAGYAFASSEVYEINITPQGNYTIAFEEPSPDAHWKLVRQTTTDYIYDGDGYLKSIRTSGWEIARLQQESEKLESVHLLAEATVNPVNNGGINIPDPSLVAQSDAYKFTEQLPVNDVTSFILARHRDFFRDTVKSESECDPEFVEPKFVTSKIRNSESFIVQENPKNNEEYTYPPILTGKFLTESEQTVVTNRVYPFKHEVRAFAQNSEGEYAKNTIALGTTTQNIGKPGIHSRLDSKIIPATEPVNRSHNGIDYYLHSEGISSGVKTQEGTKSYPDIKDPLKVKEIAEIELSILNTQNSIPLTIDIIPDYQINPGDRVFFMGIEGIAFNVSESLKVEKGYLVSTAYNITLGRLVKPRLRLEARKATTCNHGHSIAVPVSAIAPIEESDELGDAIVSC